MTTEENNKILLYNIIAAEITDDLEVHKSDELQRYDQQR